MIAKLNPLLKSRFLETIRVDRSTYLKTFDELNSFIDENYKDEELQRKLKVFLKYNNDVRTFFQIRDKATELSE